MKTLGNPRDRAEIIGRLRNVRPDSVPRWGRMSAHQMICHLADALRMALGQKTVSAASSPLHRTIVKWMALYVPVPWPAGIPTRPEIDQEGSGTRPLEFVSDVAQVELLLGSMAQDQRTTFPAHPIFGALSRQAWLRWTYVHTDHHLRQFGA